MKLDNKTILKLAEHLENAELQARDVTMITAEHPDMDWDDAYAIQDEIRRRKEARGHRTVGLKAGRSYRRPSERSRTKLGIRRRERRSVFVDAISALDLSCCRPQLHRCCSPATLRMT